MDQNFQPSTPIPNQNTQPLPPSYPPQTPVSPQIPPQPVPSSPSQPQPTKKINFLKFGLFEFLFVFLLLSTILGLLQILHVINVASFLTRSKNSAAISYVVPSLPPARPTPLTLNTIALAPLTAYVTNTLKSQFLPSETLDKLTGSIFQNTLQAHWEQNHTPVTLVGFYQPDGSSSSPALMSLTITNASSGATLTSPISTSSAQTLVDTYFLPFATNAFWQCSTSQNNSVCNLIEKNTSGITGYQVILNPSLQTSSATVLIKQCSISSTSKLYAQNVSCFITP